MIQFNQYLKEEDNPMQLIEKDCQPFLKAIGGDINKFSIFRGIKKTKKEFFKKKVRKDRKPSDMFKLGHDILNDLFQKKFKIKCRSECLFVTGDPKFAKGYGKVYTIYPIGNFKFYWNPKIEDLFADAPKESFDFKVGEEKLIKIFEPIVNGYQTTNLKKAIKSKNEIMIDCNEYYAKLEESNGRRSDI